MKWRAVPVDESYDFDKDEAYTEARWEREDR
jgi:hypothetical protein